jgi:hypothetical protein
MPKFSMLTQKEGCCSHMILQNFIKDWPRSGEVNGEEINRGEEGYGH